MEIYFRIVLLSFTLSLLGSCGEEEIVLQDTYSFQVAAHFPPAVYDFERNPITEAGVRLGKRLFNDPGLSSDGSVACSNCHIKSIAFADPQHRLSVGVGDRIGRRNTPMIANMAFYREFFWDGGVAHLDFVPINAIENPVEMDASLASVVERLRADDTYRRQFRVTFGQDTITSGLLFQAFSQYMALIVSDRSKYDEVVLGRNQASFSPLEQAGEQLFKLHCANCHQPPLFTNQDYANNGLDSSPSDEGRAAISGRATDWGKFRVPSLRNIALTAPYMHDGRFQDLNQVLTHYRLGIQSSPTLAPELDGGLAFSEADQAAIIAFLATLTDWEMLRDTRF